MECLTSEVAIVFQMLSHEHIVRALGEEKNTIKLSSSQRQQRSYGDERIVRFADLHDGTGWVDGNCLVDSGCH